MGRTSQRTPSDSFTKDTSIHILVHIHKTHFFPLYSLLYLSFICTASFSLPPYSAPSSFPVAVSVVPPPFLLRACRLSKVLEISVLPCLGPTLPQSSTHRTSAPVLTCAGRCCCCCCCCHFCCYSFFSNSNLKGARRKKKQQIKDRIYSSLLKHYDGLGVVSLSPTRRASAGGLASLLRGVHPSGCLDRPAHTQRRRWLFHFEKRVVLSVQRASVAGCPSRHLYPTHFGVTHEPRHSSTKAVQPVC